GRRSPPPFPKARPSTSSIRWRERLPPLPNRRAETAQGAPIMRGDSISGTRKRHIFSPRHAHGHESDSFSARGDFQGKTGRLAVPTSVELYPRDAGHTNGGTTRNDASGRPTSARFAIGNFPKPKCVQPIRRNVYTESAVCIRIFSGGLSS